MKRVLVSYTILNTMWVDDDTTLAQAEDAAVEFAEENGFMSLVNDLELDIEEDS